MIVSDSDKQVYAAVGLALRWAQSFEAEIVTVVLVHCPASAGTRLPDSRVSYRQGVLDDESTEPPIA